MRHVSLGETTDDVDNGVNLADLAEELVAEALALTRAFDQSGDIGEPNRGRSGFLRGKDPSETLEPRVRQWHNADIWLDGCKGVVRNLCAARGEGVEKGRLANVGQPDYADGEHGWIVLAHTLPRSFGSSTGYLTAVRVELSGAKNEDLDQFLVSLIEHHLN
jgi:hypothetical protein